MDRTCFGWSARPIPRLAPILITGFRSEVEQIVEQTLAEGADAVCYKPFDVPKLLQTLDELAKKHGGAGNGPS